MNAAAVSELSTEGALRLLFHAIHSAGGATGRPEIESDLVETANRAAACGGYDREKFANFSSPSPAASSLRGLLYGVLTPHDRVRLRRDAGAAALAGSRDEAAAAVAVAVAVIAADLSRGFPLDECATRCRQTLLEEAPLAVLDALHPLDEGVEMAPGGSAIASLQCAITAVARFRAMQSIVSAMPAGAEVATALAAAFAALEQRETPSGSLPTAAEHAVADLARVRQG